MEIQFQRGVARVPMPTGNFLECTRVLDFPDIMESCQQVEHVHGFNWVLDRNVNYTGEIYLGSRGYFGVLHPPRTALGFSPVIVHGRSTNHLMQKLQACVRVMESLGREGVLVDATVH